MNIGARSLRRVSKASGTIAMRPFSDTFRRLLTIYCGKSKEMNLMIFGHKKRNPLQVSMGFRIVSTDVLESRALVSYSMRTSM